jgi:hypothetical protein
MAIDGLAWERTDSEVLIKSSVSVMTTGPPRRSAHTCRGFFDSSLHLNHEALQVSTTMNYQDYSHVNSIVKKQHHLYATSSISATGDCSMLCGPNHRAFLLSKRTSRMQKQLVVNIRATTTQDNRSVRMNLVDSYGMVNVSHDQSVFAFSSSNFTL